MGDPVEIKVRGYNLTLRKSEAALLGLFPGQRAKVRSYFRKKRGRAVADAPKYVRIGVHGDIKAPFRRSRREMQNSKHEQLVSH